MSRRAAKLPTLALTVLLAVGLLPIPPAPAAQVETVETPLISATDLIDRVARGEALTGSWLLLACDHASRYASTLGDPVWRAEHQSRLAPHRAWIERLTA